MLYDARAKGAENFRRWNPSQWCCRWNGRHFYHPSDSGFERDMKSRLAELRAKLEPRDPDAKKG